MLKCFTVTRSFCLLFAGISILFCAIILNYLFRLCSQRVLYFPLKPRLRKLLSTDKYKRMCQHEFSDPGTMSTCAMCMMAQTGKSSWDRYDTRMIELVYSGASTRFRFLLIRSEGSKSMKPGCWMNVSLPPAERTKPANMLLSIIIPCSVKDVDQKQYYDFMADYELRDLFYEGATAIMHLLLSNYCLTSC